MKRIPALIVCFLLLFSFCGCQKPAHHQASEGDLSISLPEKTESSAVQTTIPQELIGKWTLLSTVTPTKTTLFDNSFYEFRESGRLKLRVEGQEEFCKYTVKDNVITISGSADAYNVTYSIVADTLTLVTESNTKHNLVRE